MSALAMILTAAMVVPGDGSKKALGEVAAPQRLDLRGEWEVELVGCFTARYFDEKELCRILRPKDDGGGVLRLSMPKLGEHGLVFIPCTATYRREGDRVEIRFHIVTEKAPAEFRDNIPEGRLILRRVKSRE